MVPDYEAWNAALIDMSTFGVRRGLPIYLSIDDRALLVAWRHFLGQSAGTASSVRGTFIDCVKRQSSVAFLPGFAGVELETLSGSDADGRPLGVGFLASMVLAAYDMEEGDEASELNYYFRLRRVFEPNCADHGQPPWLTNAYGERLDEMLWLKWNGWLILQGWEPTANHGGHNNRYIHFPISQSVLRNGDRERLVRLYRDDLEVSQRSWDRELFAANISDFAEHATNARLRALLADRDSLRFDAVAEAAFEVYAAMDWKTGDAAADSPNQLEAGLLRTEDRRGNASYFLYPRLPLRWRARSGLSVIKDDAAEPERLTPDDQHTGKFRPLSWPLDELRERRFRILVDGTDEGMELVLPGRDFWILIQDPDDEYSDALATWGSPALGESFLLLCRPEQEIQLRLLRDLGLLSWKGEPLELKISGARWQEFHQCQVLRPRWDHVVPRRESRALVEMLRPRPGRMNISLEGGLSIPGQNVWLEGFPPKMRVRTVEQIFRYVVRRRGDVAVLKEGTGQAHDPTEIPDLSSGDYEITVQAGDSATGVSGTRTMRIASWDTLEAASAAHGNVLEADHLHFSLRGAHLIPGEP